MRPAELFQIDVCVAWPAVFVIAMSGACTPCALNACGTLGATAGAGGGTAAGAVTPGTIPGVTTAAAFVTGGPFTANFGSALGT